MKTTEFFRVGDRFDLLAQAFRDSLKPDFQGLENILLLGKNQTFFTTFLVAFLTTFLTTLLTKLFSE